MSKAFNTLISEIRRPGDYVQQYTNLRSTSDQSQIRTHRMKFQNRCCHKKFTRHDVMADDGNPINVAIYDQDNKIITHGPLSLMQVKIVVLDGEFNNDHKEQWSEDYFRSKIVSGRPGKPPLFSNEIYLRLENGVADLYGVKFQDISRFLPSGKFKLGVMAADDNISEKIQEGISEPFAVKHGRGFVANRDHPPSLSDPVYKLNKIAQNGRRHKLLEQKGIKMVQDFLRFYNKDKNSLREVFGRIPDHDWNVIVGHALNCKRGRVQYSYYIQERDVTILFNSLYSIIGAKFRGIYTSCEKLNKTQKDLVEAYRTTAYDNLEVVQYEDENTCKEHELIFGDKDSSILPSPTLPTQFRDEPSHQDEVLESVPPRASPRSHQRWVKIVTKIITTASTLRVWKEEYLLSMMKELLPPSESNIWVTGLLEL